MRASFLKPGLLWKELRYIGRLPTFLTEVSILLFLGNFGIIIGILSRLSLLGFLPCMDPLKLKHSRGRGDWCPGLMPHNLRSSRRDVGCSLLPRITTATGSQVPWTILHFDFCGMFPESSFAGGKYPTLHRAICAFRLLFTRALKVIASTQSFPELPFETSWFRQSCRISWRS